MTYTTNSPIPGSPAATPEQCVAVILARPHGAYTEYDVRRIAGGYYAVCASVGVDATLAIAQLCHETGHLSSWWFARPQRNPAGIGVTGREIAGTKDAPPGPNWVFGYSRSPQPGETNTPGRWLEGCSFNAWLPGDGYVSSVEAHVGRLLAYALSDERANATQRALIEKALSMRPLSFRFRGRAPTLVGLAGRWANPGTTYPDKIATLANAIVRMRT